MRHSNVILFLFSFLVLTLSPHHVEAGPGGNPPPAQAAPRAGAAQNPGSPQAGAREEKGDSIVENATGKLARGPVQDGHFRYVFNVPVRIEHAVTENTEYLVFCGAYSQRIGHVGRPVAIDVPYPSVLSNEFSSPVPVNAQGSFNGTVEVVVEYPNPVNAPRAWKYMCRLASRIRTQDGSSYGINLAPYTDPPIAGRQGIAVGVVSSICNGSYKSGRGDLLNRNGEGNQPLPNSRCVGSAEGEL